MNSTGAAYSRIPGGELAALERAVREAREQGKSDSPLGVLAGDPVAHSFALVDRWGPRDSMPAWSEGPDLAMARGLLALSRSVGEVVALYEIDEGATMGVYGVWKDGKLVRDLQWLNGAWYAVSGEPQAWEQPLFAAAALEDAIERARMDGRDEGQVRSAFATGRITAGASWPSPEGVVRFILAAYRAPAWGFTPWPRRSEVLEGLRQHGSGS
jgi:hypothetical protein